MTTEYTYYCRVSRKLLCDDIVYMDEESGNLKCGCHDKVVLKHKPRSRS